MIFFKTVEIVFLHLYWRHRLGKSKRLSRRRRRRRRRRSDRLKGLCGWTSCWRRRRPPPPPLPRASRWPAWLCCRRRRSPNKVCSRRARPRPTAAVWPPSEQSPPNLRPHLLHLRHLRLLRRLKGAPLMKTHKN